MRISNILSILKTPLIQKKIFKSTKEPTFNVKDSVKISEKGRVLQKNNIEFITAKELLSHVPDVREEKIQEVISKINNNFYDSSTFKEELSKKLAESPLYNRTIYENSIFIEGKSLLKDVSDVRDDKIKDVRTKIKDNFYNRKDVINDLSEKILKDLGL